MQEAWKTQDLGPWKVHSYDEYTSHPFFHCKKKSLFSVSEKWTKAVEFFPAISSTLKHVLLGDVALRSRLFLHVVLTKKSYCPFY